MAVFAVYIEKEVDYFGQRRSFGNTYHYKTDAGQVFRDQAVAEEIADAEKAVTAQDVFFKGWKTWGPTDGPVFDNVMREDGTLQGNGTGALGGASYKESCALIVWPLSRSVALNRKRWLRKFLRLAIGSIQPSDRTQAGADPLDPATKTDLRAYANRVTDINLAVGNYPLCTDKGDVPVSPPEIRDYFYTRQIGQ